MKYCSCHPLELANDRFNIAQFSPSFATLFIMECDKCYSSIDARSEPFVVCEGDCSKSYHAHCVELLESHTVSLAATNILWMCDICLDQFYKRRRGLSLDKSLHHAHDSSTKIETALVDIKSRIDLIVDTLSSASVQSSSGIPAQSSTPLSSTELQDCSSPACKRNSNSEMTSFLSAPSIHQKDTYSLFLSNIDSFATESDIECMVRQSIGIENEEGVNVVKLVPRWKDVSQLEYASFKVVLNVKWKHKALKPCTWPAGIKFREFVCFNRPVWRPNADPLIVE